MVRWRLRCKRSVVRRLTDKEINVTLWRLPVAPAFGLGLDRRNLRGRSFVRRCAAHTGASEHNSRHTAGDRPPQHLQRDDPSHIAPEAATDLARTYLPNLRSNDVYVIVPSTLKIVDRFPVGRSPQHVVPSWDLRTLWVTSPSAEARKSGRRSAADYRSRGLSVESRCRCLMEEMM
jgi:hypothetical protein